MIENMDTFWFHNCEDRKVWTPIGLKCMLCHLTEEEDRSAWRKGTLCDIKLKFFGYKYGSGTVKNQ